MRPAEIAVKYRDADGDVISLSTDLELSQVLQEGTVRFVVQRLDAPSAPSSASSASSPSASSASANPAPSGSTPADSNANPSHEALADGLDELFQEAQRVLFENPQLLSQGQLLFRQFAEIAQQQQRQFYEQLHQQRQQGGYASPWGGAAHCGARGGCGSRAGCGL